jgi:hypothetical protein
MKQTIEDIIREKLTGDVQKNALDFVAYLRANEIEIPPNEPDGDFWNASYKGEGVCVINLPAVYENHVGFDTFINDLPDAWKNSPDMDERTKEIVWANVRPHDPTCHGKCSPGSRKIIFGKVFDNLCGSFLGIYSPNAETVDCMKKIIGGLKSDILADSKKN